MGYVFGIDLGTTYSCISYIDQYGKAVVLKNIDGMHTTPSVVMVESTDNIIVGEEAKRSIETDPDKTVQFIKRKMGKENDKVVLNGNTYTAPEVSAYILKKLVADANDELIQSGVISENEKVKDVVITCPAYFGMNEKVATKTAGELAGLNVLDIINEPTAAAISYGVSGKEKKETVLVYDLGGGTFDITVMCIDGAKIGVVCTGGDDTLGGKDWDEALMDYVIERYSEETGEDLSEDPEAIAALYIDVETWKISLTTREKINISVNGPGGKFREELTREKYEEITAHLLERTKNLLDDMLKIAQSQGYTMNNIDKVLLVGGSSKMPQVAKMIEQDYHVTPQLQDPDEAVSKGAAVYALHRKDFVDFVMSQDKSEEQIMEEINNGQLSIPGSAGGVSISITNVLSRTYGIKALDETGHSRITNILKMNEKLPAKSMQTFETLQDNQTGVDLEIFETRSLEKTMEIETRQPITKIKMTFKNRVPKGTPINIELGLDNSGILKIYAKELYSNSELDTTFALSNQMSNQEKTAAFARIGGATVE